MRQVEFQRILDSDNRLRARFEIERGSVLSFMVQLESRFDEYSEWVPVVRYDTAHGFAHLDRLHPYGATAKSAMPSQDYSEALQLAIDDLTSKWVEYRRRYEGWLR